MLTHTGSNTYLLNSNNSLRSQTENNNLAIKKEEELTGNTFFSLYTNPVPRPASSYKLCSSQYPAHLPQPPHRFGASSGIALRYHRYTGGGFYSP